MSISSGKVGGSRASDEDGENLLSKSVRTRDAAVMGEGGRFFLVFSWAPDNLFPSGIVPCHLMRLGVSLTRPVFCSCSRSTGSEANRSRLRAYSPAIPAVYGAGAIDTESLDRCAARPQAFRL